MENVKELTATQQRKADKNAAKLETNATNSSTSKVDVTFINPSEWDSNKANYLAKMSDTNNFRKTEQSALLALYQQNTHHTVPAIGEIVFVESNYDRPSKELFVPCMGVKVKITKRQAETLDINNLKKDTQVSFVLGFSKLKEYTPKELLELTEAQKITAENLAKYSVNIGSAEKPVKGFIIFDSVSW